MNKESAPSWRAASDGLHLGSVIALSFQRYLLANAPPLPAIPKSLGALGPAELDPGHFLVPVHVDEAVWLGIEFTEGSPALRLLVGDPKEWHEFTFEGGGSHLPEMVPALPGPMGMARFGAASTQCTTIELASLHRDVGRARVDFVEPATFDRLAARAPPEPARPEDGYGGWRLP